jgi:DNA-binding NarL/FixJ family response regulator
VWLNITHISIPEANSRQPQAIVHIFRDVTEQAQAQDLVSRLAHYMQDLPKQQAAASAAADRPTAENDPAVTPRELEVLRCLADGLGTSEIADRMVISISTARNHIQSILDKLGAHSRTEAVMAGIRQGLIKPPGNAK